MASPFLLSRRKVEKEEELERTPDFFKKEERERERVGSAGINWRRLEVGLADEGI